MVKRAQWSSRARAELESYIDWLAERDDDTARRIHQEIDAWVERLAKRPRIGNPNRWPGFFVHGNSKRHKLIIYEVVENDIEIAAFRDMRQDNSKLRLRPKTK